MKVTQDASAPSPAESSASAVPAKEKVAAASAVPAKEKAAAAKKSTITCTKGKVSKKISAINPKCPRGYKKKA
jgi:hypothetical protein